MTIIGIDLGTTNLAMAYLKDGKPVIIENDRGERTTPSVFQLNPKGEIQIGSVAKDGYPAFPKHTLMEVKRYMGTDKTFVIANKEFKAEEISAQFLRYLVTSAEKFLGEKVTEAVITVPAYFSDAQRKATQIAGELAGLKVERIINEPTAAAIAYGIENMDKEQNILVYDMGGGTFDVSVVELFAGVVEVKASAGNNKLGGMDFDNAISEWILSQYKEESGIDLMSFGSDEEIFSRNARIKLESEKIKKSLSTQNYAVVNLPFIAVVDNSPISINYEISRAQFEKMIMSLVESTFDEVDKALKASNLTMDDISEVLLIGGSTRIPLIQEKVQKKFGKIPKRDINPDEAVALGAAIQGGIKSGEINSSDGLMVIDVCPYSLGIEISKIIGGQLVPGFFDPIILENSTVPITESKIYHTTRDNQTTVQFGVYQGNSQDMYINPELKISKDDIILNGIPQNTAGEEEIEVKFTYDINGILSIEATVLSTGKKLNSTLNLHTGVMSSLEIKESKTKLDNLWSDSELYETVKTVINRAEKVREDVNAVERDKIDELVYKLKQSLSENNKAQVGQLEDELTDLLIELV